MHQYSLSLESVGSAAGSELIIGEGNALAVRTVLSGWREPVLVLSGEEGSGKTLLATEWAHLHGARLIHEPITHYLPNIGARERYLLDPLTLDEEVSLFHLLNVIRETGSQLLICCRQPAQRLPVRLPDLASRLRAARSVAILPPDDAMLHALFIQQLSVRQLRVEPGVIAYALARLPRSFAAVIACVEALDHLSLEKRQSITLPLAREVLLLLYP